MRCTRYTPYSGVYRKLVKESLTAPRKVHDTVHHFKAMHTHAQTGEQLASSPSSFATSWSCVYDSTPSTPRSCAPSPSPPPVGRIKKVRTGFRGGTAAKTQKRDAAQAQQCRRSYDQRCTFACILRAVFVVRNCEVYISPRTLRPTLQVQPCILYS